MTLHLRHSSPCDTGFEGEFIAVWYCRLFFKWTLSLSWMWTDSCEASLSEKTEVKQIGLDFPMQHRQSTCCEAAVWTPFDPRNLLIRTGQCSMFLLVDPAIHCCFSFFLLSFTTPDSYERQLPATEVAVCCCSFLTLSQWNCCFFAHNPNTSTSTRSLISPYDPLIFCCQVISLFWRESGAC